DPKLRWPFLSFSQTLPATKVTDVFNPNGDENCGFRCIAKTLYEDQEKFGLVKSTMLETLVEGERFYKAIQIFPDYEHLVQTVSYADDGSFVPQKYWFSTPDCAQLAADAFRRPIECHTPHGPTLYLPLNNTTYSSFKPIILQLHASHFFLVTIKSGKRDLP
ncbi:hypothetical protein, partial, partial [Absidia glauca]